MIVCPIQCVYPLAHLMVVSGLHCSSFCIQMIAGDVVRPDFFFKFFGDTAIVSLLLGDSYV